jgi:UPF0271 protein
MKAIDLNCDMGEGIGNDALIMPYISSANIACGYHAGDETIMKETIDLALKYKVAIGAHVSFFDRDNFGRTEKKLPATEIYSLVKEQLILLNKILLPQGHAMVHVKPHGALYNMSARDPLMARTIAQAVKDSNDKLVLFGLSGSHSIQEAERIGLRTMSEVFADRTYQDDGSLTPRSVSGALIEDVKDVIQQASQMIKESTVTTITGKRIAIKAETICIHGDGKHAVDFARELAAFFEHG